MQKETWNGNGFRKVSKSNTTARLYFYFALVYSKKTFKIYSRTYIFLLKKISFKNVIYRLLWIQMSPTSKKCLQLPLF